jgi:hypothetical protein
MLAGHLPDQFAYRAYAGLSIQATSPDLVRLYEPRLAYPRSLPERCVHDRPWAFFLNN